MRKKLIAILVLIFMISFSGNIIVKAEDTTTTSTEEEITDTYNYEDNEVDDSEESSNSLFDETEESSDTVEETINPKKSIGIVLVEIFCAIVGIIMIALAFKANESE